jgi:hypothetical protein
MTVVETKVFSALLYDNECWIVQYKRCVVAIENFQTQQLRVILRIKWQDFVSNQIVREQANCDTIELILARKGYTCSCRMMTNERLPKQILYGKLVDGKYPSGIQLKRYENSIVKKVGGSKKGVRGTFL